MKALRFAFVSLTTLLVACTGEQLDGGADSGRRTEDKSMVDKAVKIIESCPAWSDLKKGDVKSRKQIIAVMKQLSKLDLDVLRKAIEQYISTRRQSQRGYDVAAMSRLYVLNRYIFLVSDKVPIGSQRFASFAGVPHDSNYINELWPLSVDDNGSLVLTGSFRGYFGEDYLAVQEFDQFRKRFGARTKRSGGTTTDHDQKK